MIETNTKLIRKKNLNEVIFVLRCVNNLPGINGQQLSQFPVLWTTFFASLVSLVALMVNSMFTRKL